MLGSYAKATTWAREVAGLFSRCLLALEAAVARADRFKGSRLPFGRVLMFKVLTRQTIHSLLDARSQYLIRDRLSFMRFLGLGLAVIPDANPI